MVAVALPTLIIHKRSKFAFKAVPRGNGLIEGYLLSFGNPNDTDLEGQWFTPQTNYALDWFAERPLLYHHGLDGMMGVKCVGRIKTIEPRDLGLWCQAQVGLADQYGRAVYNLTETGKFGFSSGSAEHLVKTAPNGEILQWVLIEGSVTPSPAQPAKTTITALKSVLPESFSIYLRGLHARGVEDSENSNEFSQSEEKKTMATKTTVAFVRAVLSKKGVQATDEEVKAIADDPAVLAELETPDATQGLDDDPATMGMEDDDPSYMGLEDDDAMMGMDDELDPSMQSLGDDEDPLQAFGDDFPQDDATMGLDDAEEGVMSAYRNVQKQRKSLAQKKVAKKSASPYGMTAGMKAYVEALEKRVSVTERGVGKSATKSVQVVSENVERKNHAYKSAWWTYIRYGDNALDPSQKNRLYAVGARDAQGLPVKAALNASDSASLALAVPEDFIADLNKNISAAAVMRPECGERTTSSDRVVQPKLTTTNALRTYPGSIFYPGESPANAAETEANDLTIGQTEIPVHVHLVNKNVTLSALEDVSFDVQTEMTSYFGELLAVAYDTNIWAGNGSGKMRGITVDPLVINSESTGVESVSGYIKSGGSTDILPDQLIAMVYHLAPQWQRNAKWFMNVNTLRYIRQLKDGEGRYLWTDGNGLQFGQPKMLLDFPIVVNSYASNFAANAFPIAFGDMKAAYTVVKRVEFSVRRFEDSNTAQSDQVAFFGRARLGGQVTSEWALKVMKMTA